MEQADCSFFLMDVMVVFVTVVDFRSFFRSFLLYKLVIFFLAGCRDMRAVCAAYVLVEFTEPRKSN